MIYKFGFFFLIIGFLFSIDLNSKNTARTRKQYRLTHDLKTQILTLDNIKLEKGKLRMVRISLTGPDLTLRKIHAKKEKIYSIFQVMVFQNKREDLDNPAFRKSLEKDFRKAIERVVPNTSLKSLVILSY